VKYEGYKIHVILSFIIFVILFFLWLWSYKGVTIEAKIIIEEDNTSVYLDNCLIATAFVPDQEISKIKVDFTYQDLEAKYFEGQSYADRNTIFLRQKNSEVNIKLYNPFHVYLTFEGKPSYKLNIAPYRHLYIAWDDPEEVIKSRSIKDIKFSIFKSLQWILWIVLKPLPFVFIIFLLFYINFFTGFNKKPLNLEENTGKKSPFLIIIPILLSIFSCLWSRYLMNNFTLKVPHVPDAVSYMLIGKMIASGRLIIPYSEIPSFIPESKIPEYFHHWFVCQNNILLVPYLTGHPLLLAAGDILGDISWVPPVTGAAILLIIFFITFKITGSYIFSLFAMIICMISPFFQTQTIDYMSHNTGAFYLLIAIIPLLLRRPYWYVLTGFFMGMLLNTRPLIFIVTIIGITVYEIIYYISDRDVKKILCKILYSTAGVLLPVALYLYYNYLTTNDIFTSPYIYHYNVMNRIIGGKDFIIERGFLQCFSSIIVFSLFFLRNNYIAFSPLIISLVLFPLFFLYCRKILLLQLLIFAILASSCLYDGNYFMYGPRFIYESIVLFAILYAVTFHMIFRFTYNRIIKMVFLIFLILYLGNLFIFELQWTGVKEPEYKYIYYVPSTINELKNFNRVRGCFYNLYIENKGKNKVFLMTRSDNWWDNGEGIWLNSFPLSESNPLFLSMPEDYNGEIPGSQIINRDDFVKDY